MSAFIPEPEYDMLYNAWLAVHPSADIEHSHDQFCADYDAGWRP